MKIGGAPGTPLREALKEDVERIEAVLKLLGGDESGPPSADVCMEALRNLKWCLEAHNAQNVVIAMRDLDSAVEGDPVAFCDRAWRRHAAASPELQVCVFDFLVAYMRCDRHRGRDDPSFKPDFKNAEVWGQWSSGLVWAKWPVSRRERHCAARSRPFLRACACAGEGAACARERALLHARTRRAKVRSSPSAPHALRTCPRALRPPAPRAPLPARLPARRCAPSTRASTRPLRSARCAPPRRASA
jgi:hypothetical protein